MGIASLYIYVLLLALILLGVPNVLAHLYRQPTRRRIVVALFTILPNVPPLLPAFRNPVYLFILQFDPLAWVAWGMALRDRLRPALAEDSVRVAHHGL